MYIMTDGHNLIDIDKLQLAMADLKPRRELSLSDLLDTPDLFDKSSRVASMEGVPVTAEESLADSVARELQGKFPDDLVRRIKSFVQDQNIK